MTRLVPFFLILIFAVSCSQNSVPDGILQRDSMVSVLVDIHLVEGCLFSFAQDSIHLVQQSENVKQYRKFLKPEGAHFKHQNDSLRRLSDRLEQQVDSSKKQSLKQQADILYRVVYEKHHTNKAQFDESLRYYCQSPKLLDSIYGQVNVDLEKKRKLEIAIFNQKIKSSQATIQKP